MYELFVELVHEVMSRIYYSYNMRNTLYIILSLYICINIQHQRVWNKADYALVIKTVRYVLPPHFYIRNRIVQWAFDPAFAMMAHDV